MEGLESMLAIVAAPTYKELLETGARNTIDVLLETAKFRSLRLFECDHLAPSLVLDLDSFLGMMQEGIQYDSSTKSAKEWGNLLRVYMDVIDANSEAADLGQCVCTIASCRSTFTWFAVSSSDEAASLAAVLSSGLDISWRWHAKRADLECFSAATLIKSMDSCLGPRNLSMALSNGIVISDSRKDWRFNDRNRVLSLNTLTSSAMLDILKHISHLLKAGFTARAVVAAVAVYLNDHPEELNASPDTLELRPLNLPTDKLLLILDIDQTLMTVDTVAFTAADDMVYIAAHAVIKAKRWLSRVRSRRAASRDRSSSLKDMRGASPTDGGGQRPTSAAAALPAVAASEGAQRRRSESADTVLLNQTVRGQRHSTAAIRPGVLDMLRDLAPFCDYAIATAGRGAHPYLVHDLLQRELGPLWRCHRCVDRDEFEILHGDLKSLHVVLGGNHELYNRCVILDDKPEAWARRDQPRVVAMAPYYDQSPAKQFARNTQRLTKAITKLHELWRKDPKVPLTNHMKRVFKPALY
eukprot:m.115905 g.115905  ORF g.115905 m.115905 type:complete len:525 (+) comp15507_c0_seq1:124-1698(+)